jgi:hypothetical protein
MFLKKVDEATDFFTAMAAAWISKFLSILMHAVGVQMYFCLASYTE